MNTEQLVNELYRLNLSELPKEDRKQDMPYDHYHGVDRSSDSILVSFGESWTYGSGIDKNTRLADVYGAQLSSRLGWDWVNCGAIGFSNSWILKNCEYVVQYLNNSNYRAGSLVLTFTENGRDIRDYSSRRFDYINAYKAHSITPEFYDLVLDDIEKEWIKKLEDICCNLDPRFTIVAGCNFVWQDKLAEFCTRHPRINWVEQSWIDLLAVECNKSPAPHARLTQFSSVEIVNDILKLTDNAAFKQWFLQKSDVSLAVIEWMASTPEFFEPHDLGHPNSCGHKVWVDALLKVPAFAIKGSES
jgi:hypothetical protein